VLVVLEQHIGEVEPCGVPLGPPRTVQAYPLAIGAAMTVAAHSADFCGKSPRS
jgi:hypothetical protein